MAFISKKEGTRGHATQRIAGVIYFWSELHILDLSAIYIPDMENWQASQPSTSVWIPKCRLSKPFDNRGKLHVDLLVFGFNNQLDTFVARFRYPWAFTIDTLVNLWYHFHLIYTFLLYSSSLISNAGSRWMAFQ